MMRIKKPTLRRISMAVLIAVLIGVAAAGLALAAGAGVTITTAYLRMQDLFFDVDGDGVNDSAEFVGTFPVYNGATGFSLTWSPATFPAGANGSYRIQLIQNTTPLGAPTWVVVRDSHHWASNPNGTVFNMAGFTPETVVCVACPSLIVITPETYVLVYNPATDSYEYQYTPLPAAYGMAAEITQSDEFLIETFTPGPEPDKPTKPDGGKSCCEKFCSELGDTDVAAAVDPECLAFCKADVCGPCGDPDLCQE